MQGFNKYYPPDYDGEKHGSLNAYRGKHALGDRARKIGQGILIVRFELPFNIWCGTCNNHIGMGVRYNAEKKKIGNYYSTPMYSFRCKCHLCDGYFEIETDPKNTRYVVTSGARQKDEDWDPEENGGFAVHDTDPNAGPVDPLAALEKSTDAEKHMNSVQIPRLEALQSASDRYSSDPYSHSLRVRKRFRQEKKIAQEKEALDTKVKDAYALPETLLLAEENEETSAEARENWLKARREMREREDSKRRRITTSIVEIAPSRSLKSLPSASTSKPSERSSTRSTSISSLRARILENTARHRVSTLPNSGLKKSSDIKSSLRH